MICWSEKLIEGIECPWMIVFGEMMKFYAFYSFQESSLSSTLDLNLDENRLTPVHFPRKLVHEKNAIFGPCCRPVNDVANHGRAAVFFIQPAIHRPYPECSPSAGSCR